ncbi:hemin uptake protein HemP [Bradyrhizobium sp. UFLA03-84]|uniref:hemin uptake protein HemP n=1 Tax=Bradyrhizobium sp. UFLA03-84 TaxID=418599 RepID=UPI001FD8D64F|nr:hemin uptake protein HemP [Bradyrhizobium sp. UFLA03-84]
MRSTERLAGYVAIQATRLHRDDWLRAGNKSVKNAAPLFISIVKCSRWNAPSPACTSKHCLKIRRRSTTRMSATSGDKFGAAEKQVVSVSDAAKTLVMRGNRLDSRELFSAEREIIIVHGEEHYRLRLTSQNKLILTK